MNLPNRLTVMRVCLIPIFLFVYLSNCFNPYSEFVAAGIYIIACVTDFLDGYLARKNNLVTNFGKFLDPLADKLLVNMALISFLVVSEKELIPVWVVMIIISRDFIISGFRLVASDNGKVIAADYWGKVKTTVQMIMTVALILDFDVFIINILEQVLIYASLILTVISLVVCIYNNRDILKDGENI